MEGTVKQLVLMAPHSIVYLDVKDEKGAVATWALEAANQRTIFNNGVKREDVRPGDRSRCAVTCCATAPEDACSASSPRCTVMPREATASRWSGT